MFKNAVIQACNINLPANQIHIHIINVIQLQAGLSSQNNKVKSSYSFNNIEDHLEMVDLKSNTNKPEQMNTQSETINSNTIQITYNITVLLTGSQLSGNQLYNPIVTNLINSVNNGNFNGLLVYYSVQNNDFTFSPDITYAQTPPEILYHGFSDEINNNNGKFIIY